MLLNGMIGTSYVENFKENFWRSLKISKSVRSCTIIQRFFQGLCIKRLKISKNLFMVVIKIYEDLKSLNIKQSLQDLLKVL